MLDLPVRVLQAFAKGIELLPRKAEKRVITIDQVVQCARVLMCVGGGSLNPSLTYLLPRFNPNSSSLFTRTHVHTHMLPTLTCLKINQALEDNVLGDRANGLDTLGVRNHSLAHSCTPTIASIPIQTC